MLRIRLGKARTKAEESSLMYPARQTNSTSTVVSAWIISASCSSRVRPFEGINRAFSPRFFAASRPAASARLEMTREMREHKTERQNLEQLRVTDFVVSPDDAADQIAFFA